MESNQNRIESKQNDSLGKRTSLDRQDDTILSLDSNGSASSTHGFHGIFHLEQMSIGTEYCDCSVVTHVDLLLLLLVLLLLM
jgi:hypothetical protein